METPAATRTAKAPNTIPAIAAMGRNLPSPPTSVPASSWNGFVVAALLGPLDELSVSLDAFVSKLLVAIASEVLGGTAGTIVVFVPETVVVILETDETRMTLSP